MKWAIFILTIFLYSCSTSHNPEIYSHDKSNKNNKYSKEKRKNTDCICMKIYAPVCSKEGITYSNSCMARCEGVKSFTEGSCAP